MKTRFSTLDIIAILPELKAKLCTGWRVNQVYDCDQKTYLFKLNKSIVQMKKDDDPLSVDEETANKMSFIIESGLRMHTTDYDWPKSHAPSHFATKLRKHIRNKRIENISQVGIDRLVDIQFGTNQAANHLLVELYDRGNLILTDNNYSIICILRWRRPMDKGTKPSDNDKCLDQNDSENFNVGQIYPLHTSRKLEDLEQMTEQKIIEMLNCSQILLGNNQNYKKRNRAKLDKSDDTFEINLKDLFNPHVVYGSSLLEDRLIAHVFKDGDRPKKCSIKIPVVDAFGNLDQEKVKFYAKSIKAALEDAENILQEVKRRKQSPGYIVQKRQNSELPDKRESIESSKNGKSTEEKSQLKQTVTNVDFFPILSCAQRRIEQEADNFTYEEYDSFDKSVDVYYSNLESQKLDSKALLAEREALKKLDNLKISQAKRLDDLARAQKEDEEKARMIELNCDKVEDALLIIRSMLANQMSWKDIWATIKEAQSMNDPIASLITQVKFDRNEFTMKLCDPYDEDGPNEEEERQGKGLIKGKNKKRQQDNKSKYRSVDIDISLSAHANARRFFTKRRTAVNKEKKTIEVSRKAFKNVERQTKEKLKEVVVITNITKARKRYWFENFFWFVSSDGYLVVAGRDSEQNEMLVKRYMKNNDIYVHADLHGAASVIVKNESNDPIPPKTLVEAGSMAVCYSSAWDSKIATTSWWVYPKQVSKTPPTGEYLTQGAFVIRGKKNFLPLSNLVLGFGFLFRLGEESIERRVKARLAREKSLLEDGSSSIGPQENPASLETSNNHDPDKDDGLDESGDSLSDDSDSEADARTQPTMGQDEKPREANGAGMDDGRKLDKEEDVEIEAIESQQGDDSESDDDDENSGDEDDKVTEHRLIDTLAENPLPDDVLLYSIPMCGPYSALQNFKYKVKVIPGSNKRGKAAKSCLNMFMHDKRATQREKDLLRALKDQDYARNIPNKVKVSAPNMKTLTKKRPKKSEVRLPVQ